MKRIALLIIVAIVVVFASVRLLIRPQRVLIPRFVPCPPASIATYTWADYDWFAEVPFQNDVMWVRTVGGKDFHTYRFDLRPKKFTGELINGGMPALRNKDGSRVMVMGYGPDETAAQMYLNVLRKIFHMPPVPGSKRVETFWLVDLPSNTATKVGSVLQGRGSGSTWHSSPDFRYGYTMPTTTFDAAIFLCDLEKRSFTKIPVRGYPAGWWDEHDLLMEMPTDEFELFDIKTRKTRMLFSAADIKAAFTRADLTNAPADIRSFFNWNGTNYDFYFGPKNKVYGTLGSGFLFKVNRGGPSLELVDRDFGYKWGGSFDRSATHYLFQGETGAPGRGGDGAVYLRNLADGTVATVVPPDNGGQYSIPRFYGNEVIYYRGRNLHRVELDGSNDALVLTNGVK